MSRKFKRPDYDKTLDLQVSLRDVLPPNYLARFTVDTVSQLDLSGIYQEYSDEGALAHTPEMLLGSLFYGYVTGVFSSCKTEQANHEVLPFRFIASDMHPTTMLSPTFDGSIWETERIVCSGVVDGSSIGLFAVGQRQSGWDQNPRRCFQEQGRQLQATIGH